MNSLQTEAPSQTSLKDKPVPLVKAFNPWEQYFDLQDVDPLYQFGASPRSAEKLAAADTLPKDTAA